MKVNRRRLARGVFLTVLILGFGLVVGFGSSYLGQLFSGSFNLRSPNPGYSAIANTEANPKNPGMDEEQVTSLLDQLEDLIKRCDSILNHNNVDISQEEDIKGLRGNLYLIHIDLNHLLLQNS